MGIRKKFIYFSLVSSTVLTLYLFLWDQAFVKVPIDQVYCPPNAGIAPDGTCGLYEGSHPSIALIIAGVIALAGFIVLVIDVCSRRNRK